MQLRTSNAKHATGDEDDEDDDDDDDDDDNDDDDDDDDDDDVNFKDDLFATHLK